MSNEKDAILTHIEYIREKLDEVSKKLDVLDNKIFGEQGMYIRFETRINNLESWRSHLKQTLYITGTVGSIIVTFLTILKIFGVI